MGFGPKFPNSGIAQVTLGAWSADLVAAGTRANNMTYTNGTKTRVVMVYATCPIAAGNYVIATVYIDAIQRWSGISVSDLTVGNAGQITAEFIVPPGTDYKIVLSGTGPTLADWWEADFN